MSGGRQVKFSIPLATRMVRPEPHPLDSGVGSSSSDHTGSSGSFDEIFTAQDYNIQSNNVDALREALRDAIKDIARWKDKFHQEQFDNTQTHKRERDTNMLYRKQCEFTKDAESRLEKRETALNETNAKIKALEKELSDHKAQYKELHERYQAAVNSADGSVLSGGSGEHSHGSRSYLGSDGSDFHRLKERINRDHDTGVSNTPSKNTRNSEHTASSKGSSTSSTSKPYIEKMPTKNNHSNLVSPRAHGAYNLSTATNNSSSRKHGTASSSRRGERERGDYIFHPLPDHN
ncbi:hypothetical protein GGS21DRAFT_160763 [Xylaria nigripes]|nr:hypothetical protein GGS21DRAFT_160763 [Xylaria nigripes]